LSWLSLLGLPVVAFLVKALFDLGTGRTAERRELRRDGAHVVTPVQETLRRLDPGAVAIGTAEQGRKFLRETHAQWQNGTRGQLCEYANRHPSQRVRALALELAEAVDRSYVSTQWFFGVRDGSAKPVAYEAAERQHAEALKLSETLMAAIRRRRPQWLP
jgi:hypothetical protein